MRMTDMKRYIMTAFVVLATHSVLFGGTALRTNPPSECSAPRRTCGCPVAGDEGEKLKTPCYFGLFCAGDGNDGDSVDNGCIMVWLGLGRTTPWTGSLGCSLKIFADDDSPSVFTPESLHAVLGGYTFKRLGQKTMADGVTPAEVVFSHPRGESVHFVFANGESLARPDPGVHIKMDARLQMVDAEGWATTHDPVYYDLYVGDGTRRRFLATNATGALGALVSITDERGVTTTPADMGVDIVYDPDGVRQYLTPSRLANVTRTADFLGYDVAIYALQEPPQKDAATGLYIVPASSPVKHFSIRSGNGGKRASVTILRGGGEPRTSVYDYAMGEWSLTRSSGVREEKRRLVQDTKAAQIVREVKSASGERLSRRESNFKWMSWGFAMTNRVEGFGGVTDTTTWAYYTSGNGKGQVKTEKRQSGLLIQYAYDNLDRIISKTRSGPDMMTELTTYDYTPVDANDPVLPVDTRPRTVVRKLNNIECERTYYVYSPLTNIVERVGTQGAAYGGTNVLRTVAAYYPVVVNDPRSGFVQSIRHEDGKIDHYDYSLVDGLWTGTTTHLHEQSPVPVNGKTTRDVSIANARGEVLETRTEAFVDDDWHVIARERRTYSAEGRPIRLENLAGQVTTMAWDCCHKVSEILPDGSTTTWDYDMEGRISATSRLIPLDMTNVTWQTTCYEYDDLGQQTATWQTNYTAHVGLPAMRTCYDQLGRVIARVDTLGNTTSTSYSSDGRTVSVQNPNTSTSSTTRSSDGDILSITGSAVTPEFHTYGILSDGTRWSRTVHGETANSPRFTKRYENIVGQTIREERSGFQGAVLATTHVYDSYGRLASTAADYEPTVDYAYDAFGNRIATTRLVGASAPVCLSEWRKTETRSSFVLDDSTVWLTQTNVVSCSDSTIASLVTSSARQLTGLTSALPARSRMTDIRGNVTMTDSLVDSSFVISRQTLPYATNKPLSVSRYGVSLMDVSVSAVTNTVAYDSLGRRIAHTDGRGNTTHAEYNAVGQRSASIDALGNRTAYAYDRFGNLASVIDPLGNATVYEYDLRGRKTYEGGATYPVRYTYDIFGNKTTMMTYRNESLGPDSGDVTTWLYDDATGMMTNKVYADGSAVMFDYVPCGLVDKVTHENGAIELRQYDAWTALTNVVYSPNECCSVSYDKMGRIIRGDGAGIVRYSIDVYGNVTNECSFGLGGKCDVQYRFDQFGRRIGCVLNGRSVSETHYGTDDGRIDGFRFNDNSIDVAVSYVPGTNLKKALCSSNGFIIDYAYERGMTKPSLISNNFHTTFSYSYDSKGRCVRCCNTQYEYNGRGELLRAKNGDDGGAMLFSYDDAGNRISAIQGGKSYVYQVNNLNQCTNILCEGESSPVYYDVCGNVTNLKTKTGRWAISYSSRGLPVYWAKVGDASFPAYLCLYDIVGRRFFVRYSVDNTPHMQDRVAFDGFKIVASHMCNKHTPVCSDPYNRYYFWAALGVGREQLLYSFDVTNSTSHAYASDLQGSIVGRVDDGSESHYSYCPFGEVQDGLDDAVSVLPMWSAKEYDAVLGLTHYAFRYYDSAAGRWLSRDPLGEVGSSNLYRFIGNDPINRIDYLGLMEVAECNRQIGEAKKSPEINSLIDALKDLGCADPSSKCECCEYKTSLKYRGKYQPPGWLWSGNNIIICANRHNAADDIDGYLSVKSTLFHEYIHALQTCKKENKDTCDSTLCAEIQAYYQQASMFIEGFSISPESYQLLILKDGIIESSNEKCKKEFLDDYERRGYMEKFIENNYRRCSKIHRDAE